jgi:hypothetical protein
MVLQTRELRKAKTAGAEAVSIAKLLRMRQTVDWSRAEPGLGLKHETKSTQMRFRPLPLCALCAIRC